MTLLVGSGRITRCVRFQSGEQQPSFRHPLSISLYYPLLISLPQKMYSDFAGVACMVVSQCVCMYVCFSKMRREGIGKENRKKGTKSEAVMKRKQTILQKLPKLGYVGSDARLFMYHCFTPLRLPFLCLPWPLEVEAWISIS